MTKLTVMNSTGARKVDIINEDNTVLDVIEMPEFGSVLAGNQFTFNGCFLSEGDMTKPLKELGGFNDRGNILSAIKPANGAL